MSDYNKPVDTELDERLKNLEKQVKELKADKDEEIKRIDLIEVLFDPKKFTEGQNKVNQLLKSNGNTHIFKQFQTESGLVVEIGTWGKKSNESI